MIYEYQCPLGHVSERIRKIADRHLSVVCHCRKEAQLVFSRPHIQPDGVYSYMPNIGTARDFERRQNALETGQKVIKRDLASE